MHFVALSVIAALVFFCCRARRILTRYPYTTLFRSGPDEAWTSTPMAFYELLGPESIRPDGKKRSFVTWKNHRAYNPVTPSAAATLRTPAAKPPSEPKFTPAAAKPQPPPPPPPPPPAPPASRADDR